MFLPTLLGVLCLNFLLVQCLPGGPVEYILGERVLHEDSELRVRSEPNGITQNEEALDALNERFGFDKPLWQRFWNEALKLLTFQFGESYFHHKSVLELILEKVPVSLSLGFITFFLTYLVCIPLGIFRALKRGTRVDSILGTLLLVANALPTFVVGVLLIVFLGGGTFWHLFPIRGLVSDNFESLSWGAKVLDYAYHLCLPILCLCFANLAFMSTLTKNSILNQMREDYVRTARVKGLSEIGVIGKHVLKNAAIPLLTGFGMHFLKIFFASSLMIETLFSLDGLGLLSYEAILHRDYPVVMANFYLLSLLLIVGNLISDMAYAYVDPRITFSHVGNAGISRSER